MDPLSLIISFIALGITAGESIESFFTGSSEEERYEIDQELSELQFAFKEMEYEEEALKVQKELLKQGQEDVRTEAGFSITGAEGLARSATGQVSVAGAASGFTGTATLAGKGQIAGQLSTAIGTISRQANYDVAALQAEIQSLDAELLFLDEKREYYKDYGDQLAYQRLNIFDKWKAAWGGFEPWGKEGVGSDGETAAKARFF